LIRLRRDHPELRRRKFFQGRPLCQAGLKDLAWLKPDGGELTEAEWRAATLRAFGFRLCGDAMDEVDERGEPITTDTLLLLLNADPEPVSFVLPDSHPGREWEVLVDTTRSSALPTEARHAAGDRVGVAGRSLRLPRVAAGR
jgi:isoamylase